MAICVECNREILINYQTIETKRGSKVIICDECMKKYRRSDSARDSKKPV